jgi:hypothetical protein
MRTFFGVVFALLALLCGGCSVLFLANFGSPNIGETLSLIALGGVPALIFGLISWLLLRKKPQPEHKP